MMAADALFGNKSFLQLAHVNSSSASPGEMLGIMCVHGDIPFSEVLGMIGLLLQTRDPRSVCQRSMSDPEEDDDDATRDIGQLLASWFYNFETSYNAMDLLEMTMFLVNRATLERTVVGEADLARPIYYSEGTLFAKPVMSLGYVIALSVLIGLQTAGLVAAVWYARKVPTWTATFDSMAMARLGRAMKEEDLPPFGPVTDQDRRKLTKTNALIGIVNSESADSTQSCKVQLGLGGEGKVDRTHAPARKTKRWRKRKGKIQEERLA